MIHEQVVVSKLSRGCLHWESNPLPLGTGLHTIGPMMLSTLCSIIILQPVQCKHEFPVLRWTERQEKWTSTAQHTYNWEQVSSVNIVGYGAYEASNMKTHVGYLNRTFILSSILCKTTSPVNWLDYNKAFQICQCLHGRLLKNKKSIINDWKLNSLRLLFPLLSLSLPTVLTC